MTERRRSGTEVLRARLVGNVLHDVEVLFKAQPKKSGGRHFGSRLAFDNENHLFIFLSDRGDRDSAQQLDNHLGTIVRLHDDGSVPNDNPFIRKSNALPEIYSYGHRNVQGLVFDQKKNQLWAHEHGPHGGDELNLIEPGKNYGWPVITYGANYVTGTRIGHGKAKLGMEQPVVQWTPSIAPSGLTLKNCSS